MRAASSASEPDSPRVRRATDPAAPAAPSWVQDLACAVQAEQMHLAYQPVVDLRTGALAGLEALLRWHHPDLGPITPDAFIVAAERASDSATIEEIGWFALRQALAQQRLWMDTLGARAPGFVGVNVSAVHLMTPGFAEEVARHIRDSGVPAGRVTLEITETQALADLAAAAQVLMALVEIGVTIDLDDFGAGYASLGYLSALPLHVVKIDRSLVEAATTEDPSRRAVAAKARTVLRAATRLCQDLGLRVVVEGVEREGQRAYAASLGADMAQGYLFAPPLSGEQVNALLVSPVRP